MALTSSTAMCSTPKEEPDQIINHIECSRAQDLPAELIGLIFLKAEAEPWWIHWRSGLIRKNILWAGARVCSRWRAVILRNRQFWCRSSINFLVATRPSRQWCGPLVSRTLFCRSAGLPLDVFFDFANIHQEEPVDTIMEVSARCSSLHLVLPLSLYAYFVEKSITFPILRRLSINTNAAFGDVRHRTGPRIAWEQFPLLEELTLTWHMHDVGPLPSVHCLTKVDITVTSRFSSISLINFNNLLHGSTTLQDVRLHVEGDFSRVPQSIAIAPNVENLKLQSKGTYVLRFLAFPALRTLSMELPPRWGSWFYMLPMDILDDLVDFLGRSDCPLEEFSLTTAHVPPSALPRVLQCMPHLKSLKLYVHHQPHRIGYIAELFDALCERTGGGNMRIVPFLERISVQVYAERRDDVDISLGSCFVEAVLRRTEAVDSVLRYVEVEVDGLGTWDLEESDLRLLKEREGQVDGLEIVVLDKARPRVFYNELDEESDD